MGPINQMEACICSLTTNSASVNDSGEWRCELTNGVGTSTAKCSVRVIDAGDIDKEVAPTFEEYVENAVVTEDKAFKFRCKAVGKPEPEVKWYRNEIGIDADGFGSDARYHLTRGVDGVETLEVRRAKLRDGGIYKCKIMNSAGWAACDAKLLVQENPEDDFIPNNGKSFDYSLADRIKARKAAELPNEADLLASKICDSETIRKFVMKWTLDDDQTLGFPVHLSSKCAVAGVSVVLGCLLKGRPPLRIRWYKDNKEVFDNGKHFIRTDGGFLSLEIPCCQEADTGNYMCEVRNDQGKIFTSCYLQVEPVLSIGNDVPTKPIFIKPMKRLTVNEGEIIRFRVTVKAKPAAGFKWFKDGLEVHDTERITSEVMPNGVAQLIIENANVRDIGLYACEAHNFAGRTRSMVRISVRDQWEAEAWRGRSTSSTDVNTSRSSVSEDKPVPIIRELPTVDFSPSHRGGVFAYEPMFTLKLPSSITIEDKGQFMLECCCNGNPAPTVTWFKDSKPLAQCQRYRLLSLGDWHGLEIVEARPADVGIYTVMMDNTAGEVMSSCTVDMKFFKVYADDIGDLIESTGEVSDRIAGIAALQSTHAVEIFKADMYGLPMIVPSCNLCNTEANWAEIIDREIEVIEAIESPSFTQTLPDMIMPFVKDKNVRLSCVVAGKPCPKVEWFKDDKVIGDNDNIVKEWNFKERLATLVLKQITSAMSGKYSCVAYSDFGGHASSIVDVVVKGTDDTDAVKDQSEGEAVEKKTVPGFAVKLQDKEIKPGSDVKLEVKTEGFPAPDIKWYKNDQEIKQNAGKYTIASSAGGLHTLVINKVHLSDSDCYKCEAFNECGAISTCAHVVVQEECEVAATKGSAPSFSEPLHSVTAIAGQEAILKCTAKGVPRPKLKWLKDETIVIRNNDKMKVQTEGLSTSLKILTTTPGDAGVYYCIAENEHGTVKSSANLKVNASTGSKTTDGNLAKGKTKENQSPANKSSDGQASQGNTTGIKGTAYSVKSSLGSETEVSDIRSVDQHGSVSSVSSSNGDLDNKYKRMPKFVVRPFSQWVVSREPLEISCQVVKSEGVGVKWFHNGREVTNGRFKIEVKPLQG